MTSAPRMGNVHDLGAPLAADTLRWPIHRRPPPLAASLDTLPPHERRGAAIWVDVLNDLAKDLTQNGAPPRPEPGDLGALFRGA